MVNVSESFSEGRYFKMAACQESNRSEAVYRLIHENGQRRSFHED